jgi:nitronate monooxygenase
MLEQVSASMKKLDDFRLQFGGRDYLPSVIGGMGVDISATGLALAAARLGGIGHISDAMLPTVVDQEHRTSFVRDKLQKYKFNVANADKSMVQFDLEALASATRLHVNSVMEAKKGQGMVFINCMEKLTMNNPAGTLKTRLESAMDAGIDGITLSAGLHLGTFSLIENHPRFRDVKLGIIVSSARALNLLLKKAARTQRLPDYVIVEGPLAGGHLGFGMDWADYDLKTITTEVVAFLAEKDLDIPVIAAGGVFTGSDAVDYMELGCSGVQCATRFTITRECGLPDPVKREYVNAVEEDIVVNMISPTGYPMRMLQKSPAIGSGIRPNCEAYGYLLDRNGHCVYIDAYNAVVAKNPKEVKVYDKTCLCTAMRRFKVWTCGHYTYRLKETVNLLADGTYDLPSAEHVLGDYLCSADYQVHRPPLKAKIV